MSQSEHLPTVRPEEISADLRPTLEELGLVENCEQLIRDGYTVIEDAADPEFVDRLRAAILSDTPTDENGIGSRTMVLARDPAYAQAILNPKILALAEFSVGRGCLIGSLIATLHARGVPPLALHSDQQMFPEPYPEHNMMFTACWATDEFTRAGGCTRVVPGSQRHLRPPNPDEIADDEDVIPIECPAGSVAVWDGRVWHGNHDRTLDGQRAVLHAAFRLLMRPAEDYSDVADELVATYGKPMSTLLGREDYMYKKDFDYVSDYATFVTTHNNARS